MKGLELGLPLNHRASVNLEMALLIMLLVLVAVAALGPLGQGIANRFTGAAGQLEVAGGVSSAPANGTSTDNGDGSHSIAWDDGVPDFTIIRDDDPAMDSPTTIGTTPDRSYTVQPIDLLPGQNYIDIIDGNDDGLPTPITIFVPYPVPADPPATPDYGAPISYRYNLGSLRVYCSELDGFIPTSDYDLEVYEANDYAIHGASATALAKTALGADGWRVSDVPRGHYTVVETMRTAHGCSIDHAPVVWTVAVPSSNSAVFDDLLTESVPWSPDYIGHAHAYTMPASPLGTLYDYYAYLVIRQ